ncbi:MAG: hypothetical protein GVY16_05125 [Planctomycetes bacterium]|jgi:hypothetical protein|nr:hypothetical protein [Phycisphaerae bacterium]NBB95105.1 hypothetical protein [Planctomycetota bacterium]
MAGKKNTQRPAPTPVDLHDGIPDRAPQPSCRRLLAVVLIFAAWLLFLASCLLAGGQA